MSRVIGIREPEMYQFGFGVWFFCFLTRQLYLLFWLYGLKRDFEDLELEDVPATWLVVVPVINYYGLWQLSCLMETASDHHFNRWHTFLLVGLLFGLGAGTMQYRLNKYARL